MLVGVYAFPVVSVLPVILAVSHLTIACLPDCQGAAEFQCYHPEFLELLLQCAQVILMPPCTAEQ